MVLRTCSSGEAARDMTPDASLARPLEDAFSQRALISEVLQTRHERSAPPTGRARAGRVTVRTRER